MRAASYTRNGPARDVLEVGELPTPEPAAGEVRVRLHASGVNPSDVKGRMGRPLAGPRVVPHSDGAGIVEAVGPGVPAGRIGERVWIWNGQWQRPFGTAAEYIVLPADQAVRLPERVSFEAGACMGIPALTAVQAVRLLGPVAGRTILVTGASSAVGHYVTQIAAQAGARVLGTVGSPTKAEHARAAGAEATIAYKTEDVAGRVKELTQGRGVDGIVDMDLSSTARLLPDGVLASHGRLVCYGSNVPGDVTVPFRDLLFRSIDLRFFLVYDLTPEDRRTALASLNAMLEAGSLAHTVGARFPLDGIVDAHEAVEAGSVLGNVVIDLT
ncbi:NADPH:quinone reductase [Arenibaculum pallidiluteum]|uniref:NADPH:quinone reductase n=1 Tax=Arenibaculum pallidiluteum TaxID=2812559 RepID=UPI001A96CF7A|nr:NADPH:quinone reductase [Arenibaculum pallidiluteum]